MTNSVTEGCCVAQVQKPAPQFTTQACVSGGSFKEVSLKDYKGKWVLLLFYPKDFTFVCPTEILAFNDALPKFQELGAEVLGVSCDSENSHWAWTQVPRDQGGLGKDLKMALLADKNLKISRAYGVLLEEEGIALRGLFLIDPKGVLRQITVNDLPVGRSVDEAIRLLKAFQFTDKHGEVCPANWKEGAKTMVPDHEKSKSYFSDVNKH
ncbi:hypothetical protein MP228_004102 [Amoeboaphelidium protococcarum]|nr:hypothetical protein MP228_004102 [Amoeboaphelidium protococcarum]